MKVCIDSLSCRTSIGIFEWEKRVLQPLLLDLEIEIMNRLSTTSDKIEDTISYKDLSKELINHLQSQHFGLIERVASECCLITLEHDQRVTKVQVQVSKPGALKASKNVRVVESMARNQAVVGIGSNIEPEKYIPIARQALKEEFNVIASARDLQTQAVARPEDSDFVNSAVLIQTGISRKNLVKRLKHIEWEMGRKKNLDKYASRIIDLDLLLWNQELEDADIVSRAFLQDLIEELLPGILQQLSQYYRLNKPLDKRMK